MKLNYKTIIVSAIFYMASLVTPAISISNPFAPGTSDLWGWQCLFMGWFSIQWIANPLLLASVLCFIKNNFRISFACSLCAFVIAFSIVFKVYFYSAGPMCAKETFGYYFWVMSMMSFSIGSYILAFRSKEIISN